jgi:hypothetical protein
VSELDALSAAAGDTDPARRLRAFADPTQLRPTLVVTTERVLRRTLPRWFRRSQFDFVYDFATVEYGGLSREFQELRVWRVRDGSPALARVAALGSIHRRPRARTRCCPGRSATAAGCTAGTRSPGRAPAR